MPKNKSPLGKQKDGAPVVEGPVFSSSFFIEDDVEDVEFRYGREGNPTWTSLEKKLGLLEGGNTLVFPSGMAAISSVLLTFLKPNDTFILPSDGYFAVREFTEKVLEKFGIETVLVPTLEMENFDFSRASMVLIENPTNPGLDVCDLEKISAKAKKAGALVGVDNTSLTYLGQNPLDLGADFNISSDTKILNGHGDVLFGHITTQDKGQFEKLREYRKLSGNIPGPMETWLVERGLQTLEMRLERQTNNALKVAQFLKSHKAVKSIRYPGLVNDPSFSLASRQMKHFGFIITFDLGSKENANRFLFKSQVLINSTSFGGIHSMAERRARWGGDDIPEGTIRLSVGCEKLEKLIEDFEQALS